MKIFIDSANLSDIELALQRGFADGITTNPSLLSKEPKGKFEEHIKKIIGLIQKYKDGTHLSVEVFSRDPKEIVRQAKQFVETFHYKHLSIKVQVGWDELGTIRELTEAGISVNCTACMTPTQALMAAAAGAKYVSLFWGRIRDAGDQEKSKDLWPALEELRKTKALENSDFDPAAVVRATRMLLDGRGSMSEIIAGSMRSVSDIKQAGLSGAHIVTVPPKFFPSMISHPKTDEVVSQFLREFEEWLK